MSYIVRYIPGGSMKNRFISLFLCVFCAVVLTAHADAAENMLKVGLYYGSNALDAANLENEVGSGYLLGWFDEMSRDFVPVGETYEETITVTVNCGYHVQIREEFAFFAEAKFVADQFRTGFVCYINNSYRVRVNTFYSRQEAEMAAATYATYVWYDVFGMEYPFVGDATSPTSTGVTVIVTGTDTILFEFDCSGAKALGIQPVGADQTLTWFKGYKWYGGFEYRRSTGGNINVINVVAIDDYVKGVLPYEMSPSWPLEALKAQAVCARTYALMQTKHYNSYKFDVCNTTDCQVYYGANKANAATDQAAEETRGMVLTCNGELASAYYYSSNGGASESSENVWTTAVPHLVGKEDPYEAMISIPGYTYSETYTFEQLTQLLQSKNYEIGNVNGAYVSKTTLTGNVAEITFTDTQGRSIKITGERCRTVFSTSMFGKSQSVKSMRFTIVGGEMTSNYYINDAATGVGSVSGLYTISGSGTLDSYSGDDTYVITSGGIEKLEEKGEVETGSGITITGAGSGHNVGMSQYGARAMAELGYGYEDILNFYYTGISLERVGTSFENA